MRRLVAWCACFGLVTACGGRDDLARSLLTGADSTALLVRIDTARTHAISPYIYGINGVERAPDAVTPRWPAGVTLSRMGGNRLTAYNWENNASNAGNDYDFHNDNYLGGGDTVGEAARGRIARARARGAGMIVTIPMLGYVARDANGTSVGSDAEGFRVRVAKRFVVSVPSKGAHYGSMPNVDDNIVYQDEFVRWLARAFPDASTSRATPIFYALDNEPDIWASTHEELLPKVKGRPAQLSYTSLIERTIAYAAAIKAVDSGAVVMGPGTATWTGATTLGHAAEPDSVYGHADFLDVYLDRLHDAERVSHKRLLDVLDIHWYPAAGTGTSEIVNDIAEQSAAMTGARLQAPRSLWDSTYDERSWVTRVTGGPIALLPRLREKIAKHYPGTRIAISEYYYGRAGDISGGIAQADVLGIFGREGVFAATFWPLANPNAAPYGGSADRANAFVIGAFDMFRNFDGRGAHFGARGYDVATSDTAFASAYASASDTSARETIVVVINKRPVARTAFVAAAGAWSAGVSFAMTEANATPVPAGAVAITRVGAYGVARYRMPAMSVSVLVLRR